MTLILQSVPDSVRVDIVASRHLSVVGMLFRLMTVYQPGGASERATMLRFLVSPKTAATLPEATKLLRQWAQWRVRLRQLHAAEPDSTLLVKGLDSLTSKVLARHPSSLFRLATFRERLGVDYQPSSDTITELCRMLQAEIEHLTHSVDDAPAKETESDPKKPRLQRLQTPGTPKAKSQPGPSSPSKPGNVKPCKNWLTPGGCSYGNTCQFHHDQDEEKMKGRCFCCSAEDHWADTCPVKARLKAEAKAASEESPSSSPTDPKSSPESPPKAKGKGKTKEGKGKGGKPGNKPKVCATDPQPSPATEVNPAATDQSPSNNHEGTAAINAEILNVLRSMKTTKTLRVQAVSVPTGFGLLDSRSLCLFASGLPKGASGVISGEGCASSGGGDNVHEQRWHVAGTGVGPANPSNVCASAPGLPDQLVRPRIARQAPGSGDLANPLARWDAGVTRASAYPAYLGVRKISSKAQGNRPHFGETASASCEPDRSQLDECERLVFPASAAGHCWSA